MIVGILGVNVPILSRQKQRDDLHWRKVTHLQHLETVRHFGGPHEWGIPKNGWFVMEHPIQMDDLGVPQFEETSIHVSSPAPCSTWQGMLTHVAKPTSEASTDVLSESDEENSKLQAWQDVVVGDSWIMWIDEDYSWIIWIDVYKYG